MTAPIRLRSFLPAGLACLAVLALAVPEAGAQAKPKPRPAASAGPAKAPASGTAKRSAVAVTVGTVTIKKNQIDTLVVLMARSRGANLAEVPPQQIAQMKRMSYGFGPEAEGSNDVARPRGN